MSPEAHDAMQKIVALLLTMPGVGQPEVQAVTHFLGVVVERYEGVQT